jgi:hypothetical protein
MMHQPAAVTTIQATAPSGLPGVSADAPRRLPPPRLQQGNLRYLRRDADPGTRQGDEEFSIALDASTRCAAVASAVPRPSVKVVLGTKPLAGCASSSATVTAAQRGWPTAAVLVQTPSIGQKPNQHSASPAPLLAATVGHLSVSSRMAICKMQRRGNTTTSTGAGDATAMARLQCWADM